ncbi:hypothetical protein G6F59_017210 [Rhizopus arrhizus]|nr:hypothetical protein G6F59_017210 [Rhizopus arrhizus]
MPHIGHEDGDLDHVRQAGAAGFQRAAQIREGLLALGQKAARDDLAVVGGTGLPGDEEQIPVLDALRQQERFVIVGLGLNALQHDAISFTCRGGEVSQELAGSGLQCRHRNRS